MKLVIHIVKYFVTRKLRGFSILFLRSSKSTSRFLKYYNLAHVYATHSEQSYLTQSRGTVVESVNRVWSKLQLIHRSVTDQPLVKRVFRSRCCILGSSCSLVLAKYRSILISFFSVKFSLLVYAT